MKKSILLLGIFDLVIAFGAIFTGLLMIGSKSGIFKEYPSEWIGVLPFKSWLVPGIAVILLFGAGNIAAAIFSFRNRNTRVWLVSAFAGLLLLISDIAQIVLLNEWFLASAEILLISLLQLFLCGYAMLEKNTAKA